MIIYDHPSVNLGRINQDSKEDCSGYIMEDLYGRFCAYQITLFGDPETPIGGGRSGAGVIKFDKNAYLPGVDIKITVRDFQLNTNPDVMETADIIVTTSGGDGVIVTLTETGINSGIFSATKSTDDADANPGDGVLQIRCSDVITAAYEDDGNGGSAIRTATANADCVPPEINNMEVTSPNRETAALTLDMDEITESCVFYGTAPESLESSICSDKLVNLHTITLTELSGGVTYYYKVVSTDEAGNQAIDDNHGACYTFRTLMADFSADPNSGSTPLTVQFADISKGGPTSWLWDFGDGENSTSTEQNPSHTYQKMGDFKVSLTITGAGRKDVEVRDDYISSCPAPPVLEAMSPTSIAYGQVITLSGDNFGAERKNAQEGSDYSTESVVSFTFNGTDSEKVWITKCVESWSNTKIEVKFDNLFMDKNGNYIQDSDECDTPEEDFESGDYEVRVETVYFIDSSPCFITALGPLSYDTFDLTPDDEIICVQKSDFKLLNLNLSNSLVAVVVSSVNPTKFKHGQVLTISGLGFGSDQGDGVVRIGTLKRANDPELGVGRLARNVTGWTSGLITLKARIPKRLRGRTRHIWVEKNGKKSNAVKIRLLRGRVRSSRR